VQIWNFPRRNFIRNTYLWAFVYSCIECCFSLLAMFKDSGFLVGIRFQVRSVLMYFTSLSIFAVLYESAKISYKTQFPNGRSQGSAVHRFVGQFLVSRVAASLTLSGVLFFSFALFYTAFGAYYMVIGGFMHDEEVNYHPETYKFPFWVYSFDFVLYAAVFLSWIPVRFHSTVDARPTLSGHKASGKGGQDLDSGNNKSSKRMPSTAQINLEHGTTVDVQAKFAATSPQSAQEV